MYITFWCFQVRLKIRWELLSWSNFTCNFAGTNQSTTLKFFQCSGLNFRPKPDRSHLVNASFEVASVEELSGIQRTKRELANHFRVGRKTAWERSTVQSVLHDSKHISFHNVLKDISDFKTFLIYLLITFCCPGRSVERTHLLQRGMERKGQTRRRECNEHWKCTDTLLKCWPFWQLLASRRHCARAMTITFQPVHCLQQSVTIPL